MPTSSPTRSATTAHPLPRAPRVARRLARSSPRPSTQAAVLTIDGVGEWATSSLGVGPRQPGGDSAGDALPPLARPALLGVHLFHRIQGQLRRIQGHGARALRRAALRASDPRSPDRPQGGRLLRGESRLLRLLRRAAHDERQVERALRRSAAAAGVDADAARNGPGALRPGCHRGNRPAHGAPRAPRAPANATSAWPAASRSTAWPTASCSRSGIFDDIYIQPAAGRRRGRARRGARALITTIRTPPRPERRGDWQRGSYLGTEYSDSEIGRCLATARCARRPVRRRRRAVRGGRATARRRKGRGLVPGPHGVRAAGARGRAASSATPACRTCRRR